MGNRPGTWPAGLAIWVVGVACLTACGAASRETAGPAPRSPVVSPPVAVGGADGLSTEIIGGSERQQSVLHDILARLDAVEIERMQIARPDDRWKPFGLRDVKVAVGLRADRPVLGRWKAMLAAGAFRDRVKSRDVV